MSGSRGNPLPPWRFYSVGKSEGKGTNVWYKVAGAAEKTAEGWLGWVSVLADEVCLKQGSRTEWLLGGKQEACLLSRHSEQGVGRRQ